MIDYEKFDHIRRSALKHITSKEGVLGYYSPHEEAYWWHTSDRTCLEEVADYLAEVIENEKDLPCAVDFLVDHGDWIRFETGTDFEGRKGAGEGFLVIGGSKSTTDKFLKNWKPYSKNGYVQIHNQYADFSKKEVANGLPEDFDEKTCGRTTAERLDYE